MGNAVLAQSETGLSVGLHHKFEIARLGPAPYRYLGRSENVISYPDGTIKPGGCCDFCSNGIRYEFRFRAANGIEFKVGSDCAMTAGPSGMRKVVQDEIATMRREQNQRRNAAKLERDTLRVYEAWSKRDAVADRLAAAPHPRNFTDHETGRALTLLDWADWMMANAGMSGRLQVTKVIAAALASAKEER